MEVQLEKYEHLKPMAQQLSEEILALAKANRPTDWNIPFPKVGQHYYWEDLEKAPSYQSLREGLLALDTVQDKFDQYSIGGLIYTTLEATLANVYNDDKPDVTLAWNAVCKFLDSTEMTVRTLFGLANFSADAPTYQIDDKTRVIFFGEQDLRDNARKFFRVWDGYSFAAELSKASAYRCNGAFVFDVRIPATLDQITHDHYLQDSIPQMLRYSGALRLAGFGHLSVEPWITSINPAFPVDHVGVVGETDATAVHSGLKYVMTAAVWERFLNAYSLLKMLDVAPEKDTPVSLLKARTRFKQAIDRFNGTYKLKMWEEEVIDFVIALETLYKPGSHGTQKQVARAISNLLGTSETETDEIQKNIGLAYKVRNTVVHGDTVQRELGQEFVHSTVSNAGGEVSEGDHEMVWYALEVLRDYLRRSILGLLNLHYNHNRSLTDDIEGLLKDLHTQPDLRKQIQAEGLIYPLAERPEYPAKQK